MYWPKRVSIIYYHWNIHCKYPLYLRCHDFNTVPLYSSPIEHIFADSNILVREDEPSSIISYMLGSTFYNEKLHRKRESRMSKVAVVTDLFNDTAEKQDTSQSTTQETKPFFLEMFPETDERERPWKFCKCKAFLWPLHKN